MNEWKYQRWGYVRVRSPQSAVQAEKDQNHQTGVDPAATKGNRSMSLGEWLLLIFAVLWSLFVLCLLAEIVNELREANRLKREEMEGKPTNGRLQLRDR